MMEFVDVVGEFGWDGRVGGEGEGEEGASTDVLDEEIGI